MNFQSRQKISEIGSCFQGNRLNLLGASQNSSGFGKITVPPELPRPIRLQYFHANSPV